MFMYLVHAVPVKVRCCVPGMSPSFSGWNPNPCINGSTAWTKRVRRKQKAMTLGEGGEVKGGSRKNQREK